MWFLKDPIFSADTQRIQNRPEISDVFSWILDAYEKGAKTKQDYLNLQGEAYLIVVAGRLVLSYQAQMKVAKAEH